MEALNNIFDWLKTGWGILIAISAVIASFYTIKSNISKVITDIKKPITDLKDEVKTEVNDLKEEVKTEVFNLRSEMKEDVGALTAKVDSLQAHDKMNDDAMKAMLRSDMLKNCEKYLKSGWANLQQKEVLDKQLRSYEALGGNTFIHDLVNQVKELPLEDPKKKVINE